MLKRFEVTNYKGFKDTFIFDLSNAKRYNGLTYLVEKNIVKKALVFGDNGSGKSNLCTALMDITFHLVDKEKLIAPGPYCYAGSTYNGATFKYIFQFGKEEVHYEYRKRYYTDLLYEKLWINNTLVLEYNYADETHFKLDLAGTETLNKIKLQPQLSFIKYIFSNTIQNEKSIIKQLVEFVSGMLYFRNLIDGNRYIGFKNGSADLYQIILQNNKLEDFRTFLNEFGLRYNLIPFINNFGLSTFGIKFENGNIVEFSNIISSGTRTLWLFYCWLLDFPKLTFLVMDEFDAYYHYEMSEKILKTINKFNNLQAILTSHTTYLMNKELTRPDCCFLIKDNASITSISSKKEIRENNNIEKMYRDKEFQD